MLMMIDDNGDDDYDDDKDDQDDDNDDDRYDHDMLDMVCVLFWVSLCASICF